MVIVFLTFTSNPSDMNSMSLHNTTALSSFDEVCTTLDFLSRVLNENIKAAHFVIVFSSLKSNVA